MQRLMALFHLGCREHQTGRLTEEERQRRLEEMRSNANTHDRARLSRVAAARQEEAREEAHLASEAAAAATKPSLGAHHGGALKEVYASLGQGANTTLEARISSRKFYSQR